MTQSQDIHLQLVSRSDIDIQRWDALIQQSIQSRIYGSSVWLDHLSPGWMALVNPDYSLAMPLTVKTKWAIRYLAQPPFTQQLGFYSRHPIEPNQKSAMIEMARRHFPFAEIALQEAVSTGIHFTRANYVLDLSPTYSLIQKNYSKSLWAKSLRPAEKQNLVYLSQNNVEVAIDQYRNHYQQKMNLSNKAYPRLLQLAKTLEPLGQCFTREVRNQQRELLAISLFFKDGYRIYNLCSTTTTRGRKSNANYFLYDQLIQEWATSPFILDFEGSSIPGIAQFYRKFGSQNEPYYFLRWNHLKWPWRWFKN